jgi:hypothetical protein
MNLDELTITLSDKKGRIRVETLTKALENALEMLRGIEASIVASGVDVQWDVVRVQMRSPLKMTLSPRVRVRGKSRPALGRKMVMACIQGVGKIEKSAILPQYFTTEVLDAARRLVKTVSSDGGEVMFASNGSNRTKVTGKAIKHIDELATKARLYVDFSTIEGRLEVISVREGQRFFIWETLTNRKIECAVDDHGFKVAMELLGKRVSVTGRVSYRNHTPTFMQVEEPIRRLRDMSELPQPKDIGRINITEGLTSEEHVRRMRDG